MSAWWVLDECLSFYMWRTLAIYWRFASRTNVIPLIRPIRSHQISCVGHVPGHVYTSRLAPWQSIQLWIPQCQTPRTKTLESKGMIHLIYVLNSLYIMVYRHTPYPICLFLWLLSSVLGCVTDLVTSASRDYAGSQGRIIGLQGIMEIQKEQGFQLIAQKISHVIPYHLSTINGIRNGICYHLSTLYGIQNGRKAEDI